MLINEDVEEIIRICKKSENSRTNRQISNLLCMSLKATKNKVNKMIKQGKLYNSDLQIKYNLNSRERLEINKSLRKIHQEIIDKENVRKEVKNYFGFRWDLYAHLEDVITEDVYDELKKWRNSKQ